MEKEKQMSESLALGTLLAMVGGFLDIYTYLARGKVFANAQTGNIILFSLTIAQGNWRGAVRYCIPIGAFVLGVVVTEMIRDRYQAASPIHWRQVVILVEMIILAIAALIPQGDGDVWVNVMISFTCSVQVESFRKFKGTAIATTMCTGNLRSATEEMFLYWKNGRTKERERSFHYLLIILFFILGGISGSIVIQALKSYAVIVCDGMLLVVFLLMFRKQA